MTSLPSKAVIACSDSKKAYFRSEAQYLTEKNSLKDAKVVQSYLTRMGIRTDIVKADEKFMTRIKELKPDMVFNMVGSVRGEEKLAASVPAILDYLGVAYSGASFEGESLAYDKYQIKCLLESERIPVPPFQLFKSAEQKINPELSFPVIVKLNEIHGSVEINSNSVCRNEKDLSLRISALLEVYGGKVLVEKFITGDEFSSVGIERIGKIYTYSALNIFSNNSRKEKFASFQMQWEDEEIGFEKFKDPVLNDLLVSAYQTVKMRDYGKFDIRRGKDGIYYFLDANTNPAFGPKENDCAISSVLDLYGITFEDTLIDVMRNAMARKKL